MNANIIGRIGRNGGSQDDRSITQ